MTSLALRSAILRGLPRVGAQLGSPIMLIGAGLVISNVYTLKVNRHLRAKGLRQSAGLVTRNETNPPSLSNTEDSHPPASVEDDLQCQLAPIKTTPAGTTADSIAAAIDDSNDNSELAESTPSSPLTPATPIRMSYASAPSSRNASFKQQEAAGIVEEECPTELPADSAAAPATAAVGDVLPAAAHDGETAAAADTTSTSAVDALTKVPESELRCGTLLALHKLHKSGVSVSTQTDTDDLTARITFVINIMNPSEPEINKPAADTCSKDIAAALAPSTTTDEVPARAQAAAEQQQISTVPTGQISTPAEIAPAEPTIAAVATAVVTEVPTITSLVSPPATPSAPMAPVPASSRPPPPPLVNGSSFVDTKAIATGAATATAATAASPPAPPGIPRAAGPPPPPPPPPGAAALSAAAAAGAAGGVKLLRKLPFIRNTSLTARFHKFYAPSRSKLTGAAQKAKGGSSSSSNDAVQQDSKGLMGEVHKELQAMSKLQKDKQIAQDVQNHGARLRELVAKLVSLQTTNIDEVCTLVGDITAVNFKLDHPDDVMSILGLEWPAAKLAVCRGMVECYRTPLGLLETVKTIAFNPKAASADIRTVLATMLSQVENKVVEFRGKQADHSTLAKKAKEFNLPNLQAAVDGVLHDIKVASLGMGRLYMDLCAKEVAAKQQGKIDALTNLSSCWSILGDGFRFLLKLHQFVEGFDVETTTAYHQFELIMDSVETALIEAKVKIVVKSIFDAVVPEHQQKKAAPTAKQSTEEPAAQMPRYGLGMLKHRPGCKKIF